MDNRTEQADKSSELSRIPLQGLRNLQFEVGLRQDFKTPNLQSTISIHNIPNYRVFDSTGGIRE